MNSIKIITLFGYIGLIIGCSTHKINSPTSLFNYVDKNNDAKISKDEFISYQKEKLQLEELKRLKRVIADCDRNGDKQVSLNEIPKRDHIPERVRNKRPCTLNSHNFFLKDRNSDETLTLQELLDNNKKLPYTLEEKDKRREMRFKKIYNICDTNKDDKLTLKEVNGKRCHIASRIFTQIDANKDSLLTLEEVIKNKKERDSKRVIVFIPIPTTSSSSIKLPNTMPIELKMLIKMQECDTNKDSKMSESEALDCGFTRKNFKDSDQTRDGFLNREDLDLIQIIHQFQQIDKNQNAYLSEDEFLD